MLLLRLQIRSADKLSNKSPVGRLCRPSRDRLWQTQAPRKEMSSQAAAMPRKILKTLIDHSQATAAWNPISLRNDYPISCTVRPINIFYCHPTTGRQWQSRGNIIYCPTQRARALNWIGEERERTFIFIWDLEWPRIYGLIQDDVLDIAPGIYPKSSIQIVSLCWYSRITASSATPPQRLISVVLFDDELHWMIVDWRTLFLLLVPTSS